MENVLAKAREFFGEDLDYVVDLYDLSIIWASSRVVDASEYSLEELHHKSLIDMLDPDINTEDYRKNISERLIEGNGTTDVHTINRSGIKYILHIQFQTFDLGGGMYMACKALKVEHD